MTIRIGVIGVGIIGEPVVRGLIRAHGDAGRGLTEFARVAEGKEAVDERSEEQGDSVAIYLSPRSAGRVERLVGEFGNVHVGRTNQEVVDQSDWVVLALLPDAAPEIVRQLVFRPEQRVVSLISTATVTDVQSWTGLAAVTKMVPLPFVADGTGPVAVYPLTPEVESVFGGLGVLVAADSETGLGAMSTITSMQSAFFAIVGQVVDWGARHGLTVEVSQKFTLDFFTALLSKAGTLSAAELPDHWREMTPGGLNHTAMTRLFGDDAIAAWSRAMDAVQARRDDESGLAAPQEDGLQR